MLETPVSFIDTWNQWAQIIAIVSLAIAVIILLRYGLRLLFIKDPKAGYDLINLSEISSLKSTSVFLIIGFAVLANAFLSDIGPAWMVIRGFTTFFISVILGVVLSNVLKFYYPFYVEKRLKKLRFKPRISPKSGKPMKLLSEEEEDVYLDEGMQAEENVFSIDYDVWVDEETGFTKIEKYSGHMHAQQCPECNYQTFRVNREEILAQPTEMEEGELVKYFECGYCAHKEAKKFKIARTTLEDSIAASAAVSS